jgi:hypothetical protein
MMIVKKTILKKMKIVKRKKLKSQFHRRRKLKVKMRVTQMKKRKQRETTKGKPVMLERLKNLKRNVRSFRKRMRRWRRN